MRKMFIIVNSLRTYTVKTWFGMSLQTCKSTTKVVIQCCYTTDKSAILILCTVYTGPVPLLLGAPVGPEGKGGPERDHLLQGVDRLHHLADGPTVHDCFLMLTLSLEG